ncbi:MAG TPA: hypothetical protein VLD13_01925 [Gaiellaceae bacterium]|nr:hypothetical protein [Gaiellaceae bacterium]
MARQGRSKEPLPPALPPETRPVGQLIAEAIRLYGRRFWAALALGIPIGVFGALTNGLHGRDYLLYALVPGAVLLTLTYVGAAAIASDRPVPRRRVAVGFAAGLIVFLPFPVLVLGYVLPAIAWLALVGLAVPAAVMEGTSVLASLRRGLQLGRADYVHSLGAMAALGIAFYLSTRVLAVAINAGSGQAAEIARPLAEGALWPVVVLGASLLYFDQAARLESGGPRSRRSRDADLHHADEPDRPGRADAEGEPRPAAGGQP